MKGVTELNDTGLRTNMFLLLIAILVGGQHIGLVSYIYLRKTETQHPFSFDFKATK